MNTAAGSQAPTMAELVRAISEEAAFPVEPSPVVMHLPKPHPIGRLLVISTVGLIIVMATLLLVLTRHVQGLMSDIRQREVNDGERDQQLHGGWEPERAGREAEP